MLAWDAVQYSTDLRTWVMIEPVRQHPLASFCIFDFGCVRLERVLAC
eukprot:COSAG06_NODE_35876_length_454_cov_1.230986_1_plen_46_part_01